MAKQQTRTSGGAYQNPTEGIVDYSAFNRGLQAGLKPGLDFLKEQEKKEEAEKKALGIKRTKLAGEIEDATVAAGSIFGETLNLDINTSQDYKDWATNTRSEILNPKTSDSRVKELQTQWSNIKSANGNLQYLIDIDNDPEVYDGEASDINALFTNQGTSFKNFVKAYNEGKAKPVVKTIKGVNVGGFTMNVDGKEIFLDFENKINKTTIDSKSSLNAKTSVTEAGKEFKDQSKGSFENTKEYINAEGDIVKQTSIATQYTKSVDTFAGTKAKEYLGKNSELNASVFTSALRERRLLENSLTEGELNIIDLTGKKYIGYNKKAVLALVDFEKTKASAGGIPISDSEAEALANNKIDALRNKVNNIYLKNELLKQNENFLLNPETGIAEPRGPQTDVKLDSEKISTVSSVQDIVNILPEGEGVGGSLSRANVLGGKSVYYTQNVEQQRNLVNTMNLVIKPGADSKFYTPKEAKDIFFNERRSQKNDEKERLYTDDDIKEEWNSKVAKGVFTKNNSKLSAPMWRLESGKLEPIILDASPYSVFNYITDNVITNAEKALKVKNEYKRMIEGNNRKQLPQ